MRLPSTSWVQQAFKQLTCRHVWGVLVSKSPAMGLQGYKYQDPDLMLDKALGLNGPKPPTLCTACCIQIYLF